MAFFFYLVQKLTQNLRINKDMLKRKKGKVKNHRAKEEPIPMIHWKICNKLLFTEKYDTKSPLCPL